MQQFELCQNLSKKGILYLFCILTDLGHSVILQLFSSNFVRYCIKQYGLYTYSIYCFYYRARPKNHTSKQNRKLQNDLVQNYKQIYFERKLTDAKFPNSQIPRQIKVMRTIPANFTGAKIVTLQLPTKILFTHPVVSLGSIFAFFCIEYK